MIKNALNCSNCMYCFYSPFCRDSDCDSCIMNYNKGTDELPVCKCNLVENDDDCPYYKEANDYE